MSEQLIYIKDFIENTHYIYTNESNVNYGFIKCYEWLKQEYRKKYPDSVVDIRYTVSDKSCEVFCEKEILEKGWVWNSSNLEKKVLYEMTFIPICVFTEKQDVETMTQNVDTLHFGTQTIPIKNTTNKKRIRDYAKTRDYDYSSSCSSSTVSSSPVLSTVSSSPVSSSPVKSKYLKMDSIDFFSCLETKTTDTITNWYVTELEPIINKVTELRLGNEGYTKNPFCPINPTNPFENKNEGYAKNTFCPINPTNPFANKNAINKDSLRIELKKKLNEPNFGLRTIREE